MELTPERRREALDYDLPARMQAIWLCSLFCYLRSDYGDKEGKLPFEFKYAKAPNTQDIDLHLPSALFLQAFMDNGLLNCRAIFEFLGIKLTNDKQLRNRDPQNPRDTRESDLVIEKFNLPLLTTETLLAKINREVAKEEHREALKKAVIECIYSTNKVIAHTDVHAKPQAGFRDIAQACLIALAYMKEFYSNLGESIIQMPDILNIMTQMKAKAASVRP